MKKIIWCNRCEAHTDYSYELAKEFDAHGRVCPVCCSVASLYVNWLDEGTGKVISQ